MDHQPTTTTLASSSSSSGATGTTTTGTTKTPLDYINEYKQILSSNPSDYYTWEKYIKLLETIQTSSTPSTTTDLLEAYNSFLTQFPLLFGYWKKYASFFYQSTNSFEKTCEIYEKSVDKYTGIQNNPDLWSNYCLFVAEQSDNVNDIRNLFERAISIIGNDYYARILWENYIEFEISQEEYDRVVKLYKRAIQVPCRDLTLIWSQFKDFLKKHFESNPSGTNPSGTNPSGNSTNPSTSENVMSDENVTVGGVGGVGGVSGSDEKIKSLIETSEELTIYSQSHKLQDLTSYWRESLYLPTKKELERIRKYEDLIRRPYFHPQPFQSIELLNFKNYIENEWMEYKSQQQTNNRFCNQQLIISLFERFIVYCNYYLEFWNLYFNFLKSENLLNMVDELYDRLINYSVLKNDYNVTLQYIEYLQLNNLNIKNEIKNIKNENIENDENDENDKNIKINELYNNLIYKKCIGHLESILNCISYYSRQHNYGKVIELYQTNLNLIKGKQSKCYLYMEFIKFNWKVMKNYENVRNLLLKCLNEFYYYKKPYQLYMEFEIDQLLLLESTDNKKKESYEKAIDYILQLDLNSISDSNNTTNGNSSDVNSDSNNNNMVDKTVKHYMSMWGLLPNDAEQQASSSGGTGSDNSADQFNAVSFKISILKMLKQYTSQYYNSIEKINEITVAINKLESEEYENVKKRRLDGVVTSSTLLDSQQQSKKTKMEQTDVSSANDSKQRSSSWTLDQYKQYYQQYYQYYQQFTQI